jgi:hypothetical protein
VRIQEKLDIFCVRLEHSTQKYLPQESSVSALPLSGKEVTLFTEVSSMCI